MKEQATLEPEKATITRKKTLTDMEKLFEIDFDNGRELQHKPGQFVQLYLPGFGEAPFSVTSSPTKDGPFELVIRAVGNVTNAIHEKECGEKVGIRGPFGNGFDVEFLKGNKMLFIGGGCGLAPLRSLINYVRDNRDDFKKSTILYGCKEPSKLLYSEKLEAWKELDFFETKKTVDECPEGEDWDGNVGLITSLIPEVDFEPENTYAIVCGPPVMYKFVMKELDEKGLPEDRRILSLERRMRCAIGECGHCQIGGYYVCQDGPVFNYTEIKNEEEAV